MKAESAAKDFPVVCVGGSAGGLDAYTRLLQNLPSDMGVAVIVSGYDGDGAAALRGIKEVGGITIAQKPDTAVQPDMPESAIASGYVDFVLLIVGFRRRGRNGKSNRISLICHQLSIC